MSDVDPIGAARTATFETIAVISHAAMSAVCVTAAGTFGLQSKVCFVVVYDVFHGSLLKNSIDLCYRKNHHAWNDQLQCDFFLIPLDLIPDYSVL